MPVQDLNAQRSSPILVLFLIASVLLLFRALQLQVIDSTYRERANATAIEKSVVYPARGLIYDRSDKIMVNNDAMYDLMVTYRQLNPSMDTAKFCKLLGISDSTFVQSLNKNFASGRYSKAVPFPFLTKISPKKFAHFQENLYEFPGFFPRLRNARAYPYSCGAQLLGYIREVTVSEIEDSTKNLQIGDYIGANGLERFYEKELKGGKGIQYLMKDNVGRIVGSYKDGSLDTIPISGKDMIASIDVELQAYGEKLMKGKRGSVIAIEPETGEILAMVSSPSYDPNLLTIDRNRGDVFKNLMEDPAKPLFDRTVQGQYPPGSIFKSLIGLIALEEGVWSSNAGVWCSHGYNYGNLHIGCHGHPAVGDLTEAIQYSCNAYFCTVFRQIVDKYGFWNPQPGYDLFYKHLKEFGLGEKLGIDFPSERGGNIPESAYYNKLYPKDKGGWRSPTILSLAIGQGEILMTALQMANMTATIANRGFFYTPHLVKGFKDNSPIDAKYRIKHKTSINPFYFEYVANAMEAVVLSGTGRNAQVAGVAVCGKTGTVENPGKKLENDNSVFIAFAPKEKPKIAVAVYVEYGGWGAEYAAPISGLMIEKYLNRTINPNKNLMEKKMFESKIVPKIEQIKARQQQALETTNSKHTPIGIE